MKIETLYDLLNRINDKIGVEIRDIKLNTILDYPVNEELLKELNCDYKDAIYCGSFGKGDQYAHQILQRILEKYAE